MLKRTVLKGGHQNATNHDDPILDAADGKLSLALGGRKFKTPGGPGVKMVGWTGLEPVNWGAFINGLRWTITSGGSLVAPISF
jgi:hypothetical protein